MWYIILFFATLLLDQISKIITDANQTNITIIENVLNFKIIYNEGASFSFLSNKDWAQTFFIVLTSVVLIAGFVYVLIRKPKGKWLNSTIALLFSGTIGNFIDRIAFKHVRDFIDVPFFANFNIADCCLCIGAAMLIFYIIFIDKSFLSTTDEQKTKTSANKQSATNDDE